MDKAIHKKTGDLYYSVEIRKKFVNPNKEEWICCIEENKKVTPVRSHPRKINGKYRFIVSYFRMGNELEECISSKESEEHKLAKILVQSFIEHSCIPLVVENSKIGIFSLNLKKHNLIRDYLEQPRYNNKADVLFEFEYWHPILGQGMVFEIQLSPISDYEKIQRETNWCLNGYSLAWLYPNDFVDHALVDDHIKITNPWYLKYPNILQQLKNDISSSWQNLINEYSVLKIDFNTERNTIKQDWETIKIERRKLEKEKMEGIAEIRKEINETCRTCDFGNPEMRIYSDGKMGPTYSGLFLCSFHRLKRGMNEDEPREQKYHCENYIIKGGIY
jgi:hypothetical protein